MQFRSPHTVDRYKSLQRPVDLTDVSLDPTIIDEYTKLSIPADRIVANPQLAATFRDAVNRHLPAELQVDQESLNRRLLNLRRRGEANGGLPRLEQFGGISR
jgi:hypothetical protein